VAVAELARLLDAAALQRKNGQKATLSPVFELM
jgi:hypothetical protein